MKKWQKVALIICCLLGMCISLSFHVYLLHRSSDIDGKFNAPIHLNIEVDRYFAPSVSAVTSRIRGEVIEDLSFEYNRRLRNVILHGEIINFAQRLSLRIPKETAKETLNAIDNISVFIGNRLFYFSHSDIIALQGRERRNYMEFELPGLEYNRSLIASMLLSNPSLINYYGDLHAVVQIFMLFITRPIRFFLTWFFLICFLVLLKSNILSIYYRLKKKEKLPELLLLGFIVFISFILRLNGYVRYSSWADELYSIFVAANPALPFIATFGDPGNPPFYNILLRFWFMLFGWTEQSGRFFSVLIGTAAVIPFYVLVKHYANKNAAFLAVSYMALSGWLIGFSQEIRNYILLVFIVIIVVNRFNRIIESQKLNLANLIWYIVPSILLANTHYYGSLLIFVNFLFFVGYSIMAKSFSWKNTVRFFTANLIIAISLLPYFILTAFSGALLNPEFNTWISRPGAKFMHMAILIPFLTALYIYLRKSVLKKNIVGQHGYFIDYLFFVSSLVFIIAFGISMYRPILVQRYLVVLYPLLIAALAVILVYIFSNTPKLVGALCSVAVFLLILNGHETMPGGGRDVFHESLAFISQDSEAHPSRVSLEILPRSYYRLEYFYGHTPLPRYFPGDAYDVLYFNPLHRSTSAMFDIIEELGIDRDRVLRIRTGRGDIFKIYSENERTQ